MSTLQKFVSDVVLGKVGSSDLGYTTEEITVTYAAGMDVVCEEIPYSYANAVTYFNQMPILFNWIAEKSADYKNFLAKNREDNLKN